MQVHEKVAIVTGASSGVGAEAAVKLAALGARVVVNYASSRDGAEQTVSRIRDAGGEAIAQQADVGSDDQCRALVESALAEYGRLDILVNNAGSTTYVEHRQLDKLSDDIWRQTLGTNLMGPFYMSRAAAPEMARQGGGEIVMTSSVAGLTTQGSSIAYCASKAALNSLTRTLAKALGGQNIRVNAICPGLIDGKWAQEGWADDWEAVKSMVRQQSPLGAVATPADVADSLLSVITGSDLMTGQIITIDAGFTIT